MLVVQSKVEVRSTPASRTYYLIQERQVSEAVGAGAFETTTQKTDKLNEYLSTQIGDSTDGSPFVHEAGRYKLVVDCGTFYRAESVEVEDKPMNVFNISCTALP